MSDRRKVFINCPYDKEYFNFFQLLVYFCFFFSYEPCFASEDFSSSSRIQKIEEMIEQSSIGIHDISRIKLTDNHPRFNMPFELGMDYMYSQTVNKDKRILVLDIFKDGYRRTISDLNCSDIEAHEENPQKLIDILRKFFVSIDKLSNVPSSRKMFLDYKTSFKPWLSDNLKMNCVRKTDLEMSEYKNKVSYYFENVYSH